MSLQSLLKGKSITSFAQEYVYSKPKANDSKILLEKSQPSIKSLNVEKESLFDQSPSPSLFTKAAQKIYFEKKSKEEEYKDKENFSLLTDRNLSLLFKKSAPPCAEWIERLYTESSKTRREEKVWRNGKTEEGAPEYKGARKRTEIGRERKIEEEERRKEGGWKEERESRTEGKRKVDLKAFLRKQEELEKRKEERKEEERRREEERKKREVLQSPRISKRSSKLAQEHLNKNNLTPIVFERLHSPRKGVDEGFTSVSDCRGKLNYLI